MVNAKYYTTEYLKIFQNIDASTPQHSRSQKCPITVVKPITSTRACKHEGSQWRREFVNFRNV